MGCRKGLGLSGPWRAGVGTSIEDTPRGHRHEGNSKASGDRQPSHPQGADAAGKNSSAHVSDEKAQGTPCLPRPLSQAAGKWVWGVGPGGVRLYGSAQGSAIREDAGASSPGPSLRQDGEGAEELGEELGQRGLEPALASPQRRLEMDKPQLAARHNNDKG